MNAFGRAALALIEGIVGERVRYRGLHGYRVVGQSGMLVDLEPVDTKLGLPKLPKTPVRLSVPGMQLELANGTECVVGFVDADGAKAVVVGFDGTGSGDVGRVLRVGDLVMLPTGGPPAALAIDLAPTVTEPGPPGVGYSRTSL